MHAIAAMAKRRLKKIMTSKRLGRHLRVLPPLTNWVMKWKKCLDQLSWPGRFTTVKADIFQVIAFGQRELLKPLMFGEGQLWIYVFLWKVNLNGVWSTSYAVKSDIKQASFINLS